MADNEKDSAKDASDATKDTRTDAGQKVASKENQEKSQEQKLREQAVENRRARGETNSSRMLRSLEMVFDAAKALAKRAGDMVGLATDTAAEPKTKGDAQAPGRTK